VYNKNKKYYKLVRKIYIFANNNYISFTSM